MKRYLGLILANGILLGLYALYAFINGFITLIERYGNGIDWGIQWTFQFLFTMFFLVATTLMAFFVRKNKVFIIPVIVFVIYEWGTCSVGLISYLVQPNYYSWTYIPQFIFLTAILIVSLIEFVFAKPFSKSESKDGNIAPASLEDISKAKKLLDEGAITNEEFYEIKRRSLK